jgi:hypothetical protein
VTRPRTGHVSDVRRSALTCWIRRECATRK